MIKLTRKLVVASSVALLVAAATTGMVLTSNDAPAPQVKGTSTKVASNPKTDTTVAPATSTTETDVVTEPAATPSPASTAAPKKPSAVSKAVATTPAGVPAVAPVAIPVPASSPAPVEPTPQPSYRVELREKEAFLAQPPQFPGMPIINDYYIYTPFDVIYDEGFAVKDSNTVRMNCQIIAAPTSEHGILCRANIKEVETYTMSMQFNHNVPYGEYTVELSYEIDGVTRTDTMDFVLSDPNETPADELLDSAF